jgi:hypothetical protein
MRTTRRRNTLIVAGLLGLALIVGVVAARRHATPVSPAGDAANLPAEQLRSDATKGAGAPSPMTAPGEERASEVDPALPKSVVVATVRPWVDIARMPAYVKASTAERMAVRDLYWHTCVEEKIPLEQRTPAYWHFVRDWTRSGSNSPESPVGRTSQQLLREQQPRVPSPVDAETMRRWCRTHAPAP